MELIAYTVVAGYVILMAVCGYLRLRIQKLETQVGDLRWAVSELNAELDTYSTSF